MSLICKYAIPSAFLICIIKCKLNDVIRLGNDITSQQADAHYCSIDSDTKAPAAFPSKRIPQLYDTTLL